MPPLPECQETGLSISFLTYYIGPSLVFIILDQMDNGSATLRLNGQWIGYKATLPWNVKYFRIFLPIPYSLKTWFKHLLPFYRRYLFCFSSVHVPPESRESLFLKKNMSLLRKKNRWNFRLSFFWLEIQGTTLFRLTPPRRQWLTRLTPGDSRPFSRPEKFAEICGLFQMTNSSFTPMQSASGQVAQKNWIFWCFSDSKIFLKWGLPYFGGL